MSATQKREKMLITCSYQRLKAPLEILPIFVGIKPNNQVTITVERELEKEKVYQLVQVVSNWFEKLKVESVSHT